MSDERDLAVAIWKLMTEEQRNLFEDYHKEIRELPEMTFDEADAKIDHLTVIYEKKLEKIGLDADLFEALDTAYTILNEQCTTHYSPTKRKKEKRV